MIRDKPLHNFFFEYDAGGLFGGLSTWCTPWIDTCVLLHLVRARAPATFLEIGTHLGYTTRILAEKFPAMRITTVDPGDRVPADHRPPNQHGEYLPQDQIGMLVAGAPNVTVVRKTFAQYCAEDRAGQRFDFIFVDGDHRYDAVLEDSRLALDCVRPGGVVAWHDYNNVQDVNRALSQLHIPGGRSIVTLHNTWMAYLDLARE
jgi:hypothetical protein